MDGRTHIRARPLFLVGVAVHIKTAKTSREGDAHSIQHASHNSTCTNAHTHAHTLATSTRALYHSEYAQHERTQTSRTITCTHTHKHAPPLFCSKGIHLVQNDRRQQQLASRYMMEEGCTLSRASSLATVVGCESSAVRCELFVQCIALWVLTQGVRHGLGAGMEHGWG